MSLYRNCVKMLFCLAVLALAGAGPAYTKDRDQSLVTNEVTFSLISAVNATGYLTEIPLGLKVELKEGWKIYWRSPGDAGLPPELNFAPSQTSNDQHLEMAFPVPSRFSLFGLDTYGYSEKVVFPVRLLGHPAGQEMDLRVSVSALVCADICIPVSGPLRLVVPSGQVKSSPHAREIALFTAQVPDNATGPDIQIKQVSWVAETASLYVDIGPDTPPISDIFIETPINGLSFAKPKNLSPTRYEIQVSGSADPSALLGTSMRLTLKTQTQFSEIEVPELMAGQHSTLSGLPANFLIILSVAFLGGLILNIMPCVLPVLSLKLASILSMSGGGTLRVRTRLLAGAFGVLASFAGLGAILVGLKLSGGQLGWGIQFQNPWFLGAMIVVMSIFTLSLLDWVRFPVPAFAGRIKGEGVWADVASGFLATLLATPCSAPLVGTAVSFALAAPPLQLFMVMMIMGLGLATPWLALAAFPQAIASMPKPGKWMGWVKPVLALGMLATILWLGSLLMTALFTDKQKMQAALPYQSEGQWQIWTPQRLAEAQIRQQAVFVDVTADWCITCKVNKAFVLDRPEIRAAFDEKSVLRLQADWTLPNPDIADYLASFERFGIPFNSLYLPETGEVIIFDELLTAKKIKAALDKLDP